MSSQGFEKIFAWNSDELLDSYTIVDIVPWNSDQHIFVLAFKKESEGSTYDPETTTKHYYWVNLDADGNEQWNIETPLNDIWNPTANVLRHGNTVLLYHVVNNSIPSCPLGEDGFVFPGTFDYFYRTKVDLETGSVVGDTLDSIYGIDNFECNGERIIDRTFGYNEKDYVYLQFEDFGFSIDYSGVSDSIDTISPSQFGYSSFFPRFPTATSCGNQLCLYEPFSAFSEEGTRYYTRFAVNDSFIINRDIVELNLESEIVNEYAHPYAYLETGEFYTPFQSQDEYDLINFNEGFLLYRTSDIYDDSLHIAVLNSNMTLQCEISFSDKRWYHSRIHVLSNENKILVSHFPKNDDGTWANFSLSIFSDCGELLGSNEYPLYRELGFTSISNFNELSEGFFLLGGRILDENSGVDAASSDHFAYLLKEHIGNVLFDQVNISNLIEYESGIKVKPSPAHKSINIFNPNYLSESIYWIYSSNGRMVHEGILNEYNVNVDITGFTNGVYFIKTSNGQAIKFVIQK